MFRLDADGSGSVDFLEFVMILIYLGKLFIQETLRIDESPKNAQSPSNFKRK